ncbi:hypothetical protein C0Z01_09015 [Photobacterium kishitanii]|uniref:spondin domain-containing protein n=1 Tax=Photobacterium kishitanii TaxID=318456 RepID=UPI0007F04364|nr:spondin domain-containing protein [Photobacterium kishitanii]OBU25368.1 hypothetical protein AYY22_04250 [Photobacterium kishitanii]PSW69807.1 hypothetical protein C0Z01_09015 [Photobacterium kishitanii]
MKLYLFPILASIIILSGCPNSHDNSSNTKKYTVTVTNLTNNQPLSPVIAIAYNNDYKLFSIGSPASISLEKLAESGDNSDYIASKETNKNVLDAISGAGIILPGSSDTVSLTTSTNTDTYLSVASMLVNTNDGFIADNKQVLSTLAKGDSITVKLNVWDSGTEANSETAATIPGPAGEGEGFNSVRDDTQDQVTLHSGVITTEDGLTTSTLNSTHRFLNPAAQVTITRTE